MIERERIAPLNDRPVREGRYVLYWMQASHRVRCNHALVHASDLANEMDRPLVVFFGLTVSYPEANLRHYSFMLEGLREVATELEDKGVRFVLRPTHPPEGALELSSDAALVVCDRGYLRHQREWRSYLAARARCRVVQVESDAVVPVDTAYEREAYSAAVLRRRLHIHFNRFLSVPKLRWPRRDAGSIDLQGVAVSRISGLVKTLRVDRSVKPSPVFEGGPSQALSRLERFIAGDLDRYGEMRSDPAEDIQSNMSPYLHFGQTSPIPIAKAAMDSGSPGTGSFVEELVVRRELSFNFVERNPRYDSFECLPDWARSALLKHSSDIRPRTYSLPELEFAETDDPYWNAAQTEMVRTGKMHGYMRMYWGKKVMEWTDDPRGAYARLIYLNNKYELDGRDPNSYAGIAWCFGKHDRPWGERAVFGSVRYMNDKGLERKFDMEGYLKRVGYKG